MMKMRDTTKQVLLEKPVISGEKGFEKSTWLYMLTRQRLLVCNINTQFAFRLKRKWKND
jgi:hypothetical protein